MSIDEIDYGCIGEFRVIEHKQKVIKYGPNTNDLYFYTRTIGIVHHISSNGMYIKVDTDDFPVPYTPLGSIPASDADLAVKWVLFTDILGIA